MLLVIRFSVLSLLFGCSFFVTAEEKIDAAYIKNMAVEINHKPWQSYQKLQALKPQFSSFDKENKLWWLLRKAQAENLLYLYPEFEQTVAESQTLINTNTLAEIVINFDLYSGIISQRRGNYNQSKKLLKLALSYAHVENFTYLAVEAKKELAFTRSLTESFETSLLGLQEAYVEAYALNDSFLIALINEVYGAIYGYMDEYSKSIEYYQKALASYQALDYPLHAAEAIHGLAATYRYWKKYDLAIEYYKLYQQSVSFIPDINEAKFLALYGLGMSYSGKGECKQAFIVIEKALDMPGLIDYKAELYKRKAKCFIKALKLEEAQIAVKAAESIFADIEELEGTRWQLDVIKIKAELAFALGDINKSYLLITDYYQRYTALLLKNSSERLIRVRADLEVNRQSVEISLLQQRSKLQALQVIEQKERNKNQRYMLFSIALLVVFILTIVFIQRRNNKKLLAVAIKDPLSNLYNRRYVFDFLNKLLATTDAYKGKVSVMLIDIDEFKQINDQYGHHFGDEVIRKIATIGQEILRVEDVMGRVGGDEFLCVLPRINKEQCLLIAQRFVEKIKCYEFLTKQSEKMTITVSIGIASTSEKVIDSTSLYVQADKALYHVKNNGKNGVIQYCDTMQQSYQNTNT
ncbi:MAG: diguanylate cyclase [Colwellia sp.]